VAGYWFSRSQSILLSLCAARSCDNLGAFWRCPLVTRRHLHTSICRQSRVVVRAALDNSLYLCHKLRSCHAIPDTVVRRTRQIQRRSDRRLATNSTTRSPTRPTGLDHFLQICGTHPGCKLTESFRPNSPLFTNSHILSPSVPQSALVSGLGSGSEAGAGSARTRRSRDEVHRALRAEAGDDHMEEKVDEIAHSGNLTKIRQAADPASKLDFAMDRSTVSKFTCFTIKNIDWTHLDEGSSINAS
jgi:hypothetical protein